MVRRTLLSFWMAVAVCCVCSIEAQQVDLSAPLQSGSLVVWMVRPATGLGAPATAPQAYTQYHETSAGSFGQAASTVGQTAGSYGQSASSVGNGAAASRPASEIGQTAGSFGTASSNIGQTAGSYGQAASAPLGRPASPGQQVPADMSTQPYPRWTAALLLADRSFPRLRIEIRVVAEDALAAGLAATETTESYPDLLVGDPLPGKSGEPLYATAGLMLAGRDEELLMVGPSEPAHASDALILRAAPHPERARALVAWLEDGNGMGSRWGRLRGAASSVPAQLAVSATETLLNGGALGAEADPRFAELSPALAQALTLWPDRRTGVGGLSLRTEVLAAAANERFAVVALRTAASSAAAFGVLHPVVTLRRGDDGRWRVLQIAANVPARSQLDAFQTLAMYARPVPAASVKPVLGITQAAPLDGDSRAGTPELWWDNAGDASLLAIEWQTRAAEGWSDTHLFFVPDTGPRTQVRVSASFTHPAQEYRWRVWSVAAGGAMNLSPWRRLTVLP